jgi:hypothetical protein
LKQSTLAFIAATAWGAILGACSNGDDNASPAPLVDGGSGDATVDARDAAVGDGTANSADVADTGAGDASAADSAADAVGADASAGDAGPTDASGSAGDADAGDAGPTDASGGAGDAADAGAGEGGIVDAGDAGPTAGRCWTHDPNKMALFGDLHVHTSYSFDAYAFGTKLTPGDAYAIAKGEARTLQGGVTVQLSRPLDFAAVTDHSEFLGEVQLCLDGDAGDPSYASATCTVLRTNAGKNPGYLTAFATVGAPLNLPSPAAPDASPAPQADVCGADGGLCVAPNIAAWQAEQQFTAAANDDTPSCTFASLYAYEWTATPGGSHHHRNVIFRTSAVPARPVTYFDQTTPEGLWAELNSVCTNAGTGCQVLAIPHNSNLSHGLQFELEDSLTAQQAQTRANMEPLAEIYQNKGYSECKVGAHSTDPLCNFEQVAPPICAAGQDAGCVPLCDNDSIVQDTTCEEPLNYVRNGLKAGLAKEQQIGVNPLKLGLIADTDTHNASPGAVEEYQWKGHLGLLDADPQDRVTSATSLGAGGLTGVWAEENSREFIWDALKRRETFATSGTRIKVRFFGGWGLPANSCTRQDAIAVAYATGVPMGGDLSAQPATATAPNFFLWATKDPGTEDHPGTPLQRLQVIKGWVDPATGASQEKAYEVAGDPNNGAAVDPSTCVQTGPGSDLHDLDRPGLQRGPASLLLRPRRRKSIVWPRRVRLPDARRRRRRGAASPVRRRDQDDAARARMVLTDLVPAPVSSERSHEP